jgi:hypothetical protein
LSSDSTSPPAAGSTAEHDDDDNDGEDLPDVGNPNADAPPPPPGAGTASAQLAVTLAQPTPTVDLGQETDLDVTVTPKGGFSGPVTLSVSGLPAGVTAAPADVNVAGGPATAKLKLVAALDAVATPVNTSVPLVVSATSSASTATANANFKVAPRLKLVIPVNVDALRAAQVTYRDEWGAAFGASQKPLRTQQGNGIVVTVFNADSKSHIIHGQNGFAHGNTGSPIPPNSVEPRTRTLNVGTNCSGYPHDGAQGPGASFRIRVVAAN